MTTLGIGGLFFRSRDPDARAAWYREHLGIDAGHDAIWKQDAGMTVFAPFPSDSDYFADDQSFMLNLRVTNLDHLVARLTAAGIDVDARPEWDTEIGRFVRIHDPEGLPLELWELPADS
ncbi:VOC family protein [Gulosibacter faecalis]|uniref:VOC family protein n=1 Tax=Gulosibacter faecalis TaxID=272240 RepID=A0ABW5V1E4_9MICO|nr:VOC family protein [Gulosibacter faecalis]